jgi:ubiquinone biosynthesis protein
LNGNRNRVHPRGGESLEFKALKPNAEERLLEDLAIWPDLGDYLEERSLSLGLATLDFRSLLDGVARLLRIEIRLDREQDRLERARRFFADSPNVVIPELIPFCTPRLTAMQRIDGVKVTDSSVAPGLRRRLADHRVEQYANGGGRRASVVVCGGAR